VARIVHKVRGIDATPHQLEQLTRMHEEDAFSAGAYTPPLFSST